MCALESLSLSLHLIASERTEFVCAAEREAATETNENEH